MKNFSKLQKEKINLKSNDEKTELKKTPQKHKKQE